MHYEFLSKMCQEDVEYQIIIALVLGLLIAPISWGLQYTFIFIAFFELYVFSITATYPPIARGWDRIVINLFFIFGWVLSRMLFCNETGFEYSIRHGDTCFY
jgi:hypothetical protein